MIHWTTLFPGLVGHLVLLTGMALVMPLLPWKIPFVRFFAASLVVFYNVLYLKWRLFETLPEPSFSPAFIWSVALFAAEMIAVLQVSQQVLLFTRLSDRTEEANENERVLRSSNNPPSVDVFIATVNENLDILDRAINAANGLDYPNFKVWILDDGSRDWLRDFCEMRQVGYFRRDTRKGFKSGNINNALAQTMGDFVLMVDADFAVYPQFLSRTVGFMANPKIAIVQAPGNLINPDPIQHNLLGEKAWPEEQRVFTDIVQPARDTWDNSFCYGGTFLFRRSALLEIGGMPEDSITEDLFSSYVLKARGYTVRYLNENLSEGMAAESLAEFIKQRCRWAIGTLQCLYLKDGPLRASGLSLTDRFFFLDPAVFYLGFFWQFLVLIIPAVYWWTGLAPFNAEVGHLITMLLPRMALSMMVLFWLTDRRVVPIVSELGRITGIFYLLPAVIKGIFHPFGHSFQVTLKGQARNEYAVNWPIIRPFLILGIITIAGMVVNLGGFGGLHLMWATNTPLVLAFTVYVLWMIFLACLVCLERPNPGGGLAMVRATHRGGFFGSLIALLRSVLVH